MLYLSKSKVREKIDKRVMPNVNEVDGDLEISQRGMDRLEDIADDGGSTLNELVENFKAKFFGDKKPSMRRISMTRPFASENSRLLRECVQTFRSVRNST